MKSSLLLLSVLLVSLSEASISQGRAVYTQECLQCHLNGKAVAGQKNAAEWEALFQDEAEGKTLSGLHLEQQKAKPSWDYFKGKRYQEQKKDIKDFLIKYSADRSKHTSCH